MTHFEVGSKVDIFKGKEGTLFDINGAGAVLFVAYDSPTKQEIMQFKQRKYEIRFTEIAGVIVITAKIGSLNWVDATFSPHLASSDLDYQWSAAGMGLAFNVILVDARTGRIEAIHLLGLSEHFTRSFYDSIRKQKEQLFNKERYMQAVRDIYKSCSTEMLVKMSTEKCVFK